MTMIVPSYITVCTVCVIHWFALITTGISTAVLNFAYLK